jgi:pyruvate,water dikinase
MIASEASGIMFTLDPVTNDKSKIVIEAIFGLGELIVQGAVTPDHYEVSKSDLTILSKNLSQQTKMMVKKGSLNKEVQLSQAKGKRQKISDAYIHQLALLGKKLEEHYYFPQDCEWAIAKGSVYIVQTRPVTTVRKTLSTPPTIHQEVFLKGDPASPGIAAGTVKIIQSAKELSHIKPGDILVAPQTNPDFVPAMKKAVAIITEQGGRTSHAAIISRELGIPAIVGTPDARKKLVDNMIITVKFLKEMLPVQMPLSLTNKISLLFQPQQKYMST